MFQFLALQHWSISCAVLALYTFIGLFLDQLTGALPESLRQKSATTRAMYFVVNAWCWPVLWVIILCWLIVEWYGDPEAPSIKQMLLTIMSYESWIYWLRMLTAIVVFMLLGWYIEKTQRKLPPLPTQMASIYNPHQFYFDDTE